MYYPPYITNAMAGGIESKFSKQNSCDRDTVSHRLMVAWAQPCGMKSRSPGRCVTSNTRRWERYIWRMGNSFTGELVADQKSGRGPREPGWNRIHRLRPVSSRFQALSWAWAGAPAAQHSTVPIK